MTDEISSASGSGGSRSTERSLDQRFEKWEAVVLALATLLTAWAAFQATKWGGVQANNFSAAAAVRAQAVEAEADGDAELNIDVEVFLQWLEAFHEETMLDADASRDENGTYRPDPETFSGFLHDRFRGEFLVAFDEWIAERPIQNPDASGTPFDLPSYRNANLERSDDLEVEADELAAVARRANQRGDNYVLVAVLFASVMLFAGISSKMDTPTARIGLFATAVVFLSCGVIALAVMPRTF